MKATLSTLSAVALVLIAAPAFAVSTTVTYSSPILVILFVGLCALIIVAQLIPAVLMLIGMTKAVVPRKAKKC